MTAPPIDLFVVNDPAPSPQTRRERVAEIREACDLTVGMVIAMGGSPATAYITAADLAYGLEDPDRRPKRWPHL